MTRSISQQRRILLGAGLSLAVAGIVPSTLAQAAAAAGGARQLRIGHQKGLLSILRGRGTLEKRLAPLGVTVSWTEFTAGPPQLEALNVGSIDFGDVGEAPPIFAQAAGAPLVYYGQTVPRPASEAIVVPSNSALRSAADLRRKKIALNKGSNVHYLLVRLLEKYKIPYDQVNLFWLAPSDARAAFVQGSVDAWA
ncbi:MAG: ABC transporter substrate-binding protein, partial [Janthinobacterium lividum]